MTGGESRDVPAPEVADLQHVFDSKLVPKVVVTCADGRLAYANSLACGLLGRQDLVGQELGSLLRCLESGESMSSSMDFLEFFQTAGWLGRKTFHFQGDGTAIHILAEPIDAVLPGHALLVLRRITTLSSLEESERDARRLQLAASGIHQGLWEWRIDEDDYYWSPTFKRLLGYGEDEIEASRDGLFQAMHPEDRPLVLHRIALHFSGACDYDIRYRLKVKSGEYRWFRATGQAFFDEEGKPLRAAGFLADVHDQVLEEMAEVDKARRLKLQHQTILALANDANFAQGDFTEACARISECACEVLSAGRSGVMMLEEDGLEMRTEDLFVQESGQHFAGEVFDLSAFPVYLEELGRSRVLAIRDPYEDPRTAGFARAFLEKRSIRSILDAPIRHQGRVIGTLFVCDVDAPRDWTEDEIRFAADLAQ